MNTANLAQSRDVMCGRMHVYGLLARLFRVEIDDGFLESLKTSEILEADDALPSNLGHGIGLMRGYLASPAASSLDLARDYAKVFCGASSTNKTAAYPFESVYTSEKGLLMQEARDDALGWYHRFGLGKSAEWHDCEDHLALELEFLAFLINESIEVLDVGNIPEVERFIQAQKDFMESHLINWVPLFAEKVIRFAKTDFYKGLASFAVAYLDQDYSALIEDEDPAWI
ncbi:MAG: molecular chaperone TorD family protein [Coriobacteriales bacterium]|jgi:TorA maturation chaperone TorD|nr:molecular chaperone TorD family protein [Coriobacteriales bacterium]